MSIQTKFTYDFWCSFIEFLQIKRLNAEFVVMLNGYDWRWSHYTLFWKGEIFRKLQMKTFDEFLGNISVMIQLLASGKKPNLKKKNVSLTTNKQMKQ